MAGAGLALEEYCSDCGQVTLREQWVGCKVCQERANSESMPRAAAGGPASASPGEKSYRVQTYSYKWYTDAYFHWGVMYVYLNKTAAPPYIRFGDGGKKPLSELIVSPQKKKMFGLAARNTDGHEDALVFRVGGRKYFLSDIKGLMEALEGTKASVRDQPYRPSGGGGKKKRRKYSKKYTKRRKSNKRNHTKHRKSKKKTKRRR